MTSSSFDNMRDRISTLSARAGGDLRFLLFSLLRFDFNPLRPCGRRRFETRYRR